LVKGVSGKRVRRGNRGDGGCALGGRMEIKLLFTKKRRVGGNGQRGGSVSLGGNVGIFS